MILNLTKKIRSTGKTESGYFSNKHMRPLVIFSEASSPLPLRKCGRFNFLFENAKIVQTFTNLKKIGRVHLCPWRNCGDISVLCSKYLDLFVENTVETLGTVW